jgi:Na+-translocating ferredoxin:NAD+ oxidoreductase RnfE subunit
MPDVAKPRILWIVLLDLIIVSVLTWLLMTHVVSLYPTLVIVYPTLLVINFLAIGRASHRRNSPPRKDGRMIKLAWFAAAVFTAGSIAQIVFLIGEPGIRTTTQALLGMLLAGYAWSLVYRLRRDH